MQESTVVSPVREHEAPFAVEMRNICKSWPGVVANDQVHLTVRKGEIHALVGENGAGKSTLMNTLYGLVHPDSGEIFINGKHANIGGPRDAISLGIGMVHQHFMLIPPLTVAENIVLGKEPGGLSAAYNPGKARVEILALSKQYGLPIDPNARVAPGAIVRNACGRAVVDCCVRLVGGEASDASAQGGRATCDDER